MSNSGSNVDPSSAGHSVALVTASNLPQNTLRLPQGSCPRESINDGTQGDRNNCMNLERKRKPRRRRLSQKQYMSLKLARDSLIIGRQYVSAPLMRANGMTKLGLITLVGRDGVKWAVNFRGEKFGRLCLGRGWKHFAVANGLKTGEFFTFEFVRENGIQMLRLVYTESTSSIRETGESFIEEDSVSTEAYNINQEDEEKNNIEERSTNTSSLVQIRKVTLPLVPEDVKAGTLYLPSQYVEVVGIKNLGKITLLGKDKMKWGGCLMSRDGTVAVGCGWKDFCEANGVKTGGSFTLEFIKEREDTGPVFSFCPNSSG